MSKLTKSEKEVLKKFQRKGGLARKKKYPNAFSEMGKKGMASRWKNKDK